MYKKIMVPVDLEHADRLEKTIATAADLARQYDIPICFVAVTAETPTRVAHNPDEFAAKLKALGSEQAGKYGVSVETAAYPLHDPAVQLEKTLLNAATENQADLIVMASHVPGVADHWFASHSGTIASNAPVSVFLIR